MRRIGVSLVAIGALVGLTGCGRVAATEVAPDCVPTSSDFETVSEGQLTVGVPENLPWTTTTGNDADGYEIDLIKLIAADLCLELVFMPVTYGTGVPMISQQERVDMISGGWYVTESRAEQVGFTTPTFYDSMAIISKQGAEEVDELEAMNGVGSGAGFSWEADMSAILGSNLKTYPGTIEMKQDLLAGRIEAGLDGYSVAVYFYEDTEFEVRMALPDDRVGITTEMPVVAFPVNKNNQALNDALSEQIDVYREDGTLAQLLTDWDLDTSLVVPADVAATSIR
ncbi:MAG: substrate-binding periplasmic protein [Gulosibacter sp.]|uniref:substrate-binding periplasmic protein n=1 Tax=Gulosibacter sp. TaxID=2817531 RepID=UPI003F93E4D4